MSHELKLKTATFEDASILLSWRNDELTRKFSLNTDYVSEQEHNNWLKNILKDKRRQLYVAEYQSIKIGTVRVDSEGETHIISWTVSPEHRGRGHAKKMVSQIINKLNGKILASIDQENIPSQKVAEHAGMKHVSTNNKIMTYSIIK